MSRKSVYSIVLVVVLMGVLGVSINVHKVEAPYPIIFIKPDGSINPPEANITSPDNVTYTFTADINASITVQRSNITIDGNGHILSGGFYSIPNGLTLTNVKNVTIKNMRIEAFDYGIYLALSSNNSISGNTITNNDYGIYFDSSSNNTISGNNITENTNDGIYLQSSSNNNSISGNEITNNNNGMRLFDSSYNTVSGNNVTANNATGIYLGKYLGSPSNNTISENCIADNTNGIYLYYSSNNSIFENNLVNLVNCTTGVYLIGGLNNSISGNYITNCSENGVWLYSDFAYISANNITYCGNGVGAGYHHNNTICGNNLANNNNGVYLYISSDNHIYHNNFINNTVQAFLLGSTNVWDEEDEGNYWSDYTGQDLNADGIGDTLLPHQGVDNYPLMGMFSDFKVTSEHHVQVVCNSSISNFQFNGTAISFDVTGDNGTAGFCRICIPTALMNVTYKVFVNGTEVVYNLLPRSNETYSYLYFDYTHSTQEVIIIPEFPSFLILPLFMIAILLAVIVYRRQLKKGSASELRRNF